MHRRLEFKITGMDCAEEVSLLKRELGPLVGGEENLSFDLIKGRMVVAERGHPIDREAVIRAVARAGMRAEPWKERAAASQPLSARLVAAAASGLCLAAGFALHVWTAGGLGPALGAGGERVAAPAAVKLVYLAGILSAGWFVLPKAWLALRRLRPDMNLLMTVAVAGAMGIGDWFEAATVYFLFAVSLLLEAWSVGRARRAIEALMDLAPPVVRVLQENGTERPLPPEQVPPGTKFVVRPGERIALDGRVIAGSSRVDQSPITGESRPVLKQPGAEVFGGTINGDGALEVESSKAAADTILAHIIRLVAEAQSRRAPSEQWVERFARIYTPCVLALAACVVFVPPVLWGAPWSDWIYRALVLLVISCPCALVISTPVSIVAALTASARNGVLVKGGVFMELPARLKAMAFDKTGTLTQGKPSVVDVVPINGHTEEELLQRAASLEARSEHPLAQAVVECARRRGVPLQQVREFQAIKGRGATGRLDGRAYWVGSHRYLEERGQETAEIHQRLEELSRGGRSVVVVGNDEHVCGFLALADAVRPETAKTLTSLRQAGIERLVMLTGDNEATALGIAAVAGVDEVHAELLPADKVAVVDRLVQSHGSVAMVGDGVNDAPAMARSTLGIAMGAGGSDAAIEAADIALISDDLTKLPWLIRHSRRTLRIIRQNIAASIAVKALFVALTFAGYASLWAAIAADMGVSLAVIFNALRLLRTPAGDTR
jgi:Cd2+/Zn2+-exporting ATPase